MFGAAHSVRERRFMDLRATIGLITWEFVLRTGTLGSRIGHSEGRTVCLRLHIEKKSTGGCTQCRFSVTDVHWHWLVDSRHCDIR